MNLCGQSGGFGHIAQLLAYFNMKALTYDIQVRPFRCLVRPSCMLTPALTHKMLSRFPRRRGARASAFVVVNHAERETSLFLPDCLTASKEKRRPGPAPRPLSLLNRTLTCIYRVAHALDSFFYPLVISSTLEILLPATYLPLVISWPTGSLPSLLISFVHGLGFCCACFSGSSLLQLQPIRQGNSQINS